MTFVRWCLVIAVVAVFVVGSSGDCPTCLHGSCAGGSPTTCDCQAAYAGADCNQCATSYVPEVQSGYDLPVVVVTNWPNLTIQWCVAACASYNYAGLTNGNECNCGNTFSKYGIAPWDGQCDTPCTGNATQICGGVERNSIYVAGNANLYMGCYYNFPNGTTCLNNAITAAPGNPTPSAVINFAYANTVLTAVFAVICVIFGLTVIGVLIYYLRSQYLNKQKHEREMRQRRRPQSQ